MNITFTAIGLSFVAEVDYEPFRPGRLSGPPESCYPDDGGYCEVISLSHDGKDCSFLIDSDVGDKIKDAADEACVQEQQTAAYEEAA